MKKTTSITLILLFSCLTLAGQTNKLPIPTKSFIEKAKYLDDFEEKYFTKYLGKKSEHILKRFNDSKDVCAKEYVFKTGIKLKSDSCSEDGIEAEIIFPNYSKNDVVKFVDWFFKRIIIHFLAIYICQCLDSKLTDMMRLEHLVQNY